RPGASLGRGGVSSEVAAGGGGGGRTWLGGGRTWLGGGRTWLGGGIVCSGATVPGFAGGSGNGPTARSSSTSNSPARSDVNIAWCWSFIIERTTVARSSRATCSE